MADETDSSVDSSDARDNDAALNAGEAALCEIGEALDCGVRLGQGALSGSHPAANLPAGSPGDEAQGGRPIVDDRGNDGPNISGALTDAPLTDDPITDDPITDDPITDDPAVASVRLARGQNSEGEVAGTTQRCGGCGSWVAYRPHAGYDRGMREVEILQARCPACGWQHTRLR